MSQFVGNPEDVEAVPYTALELVLKALQAMEECGTWDAPTIKRVRENIFPLVKAVKQEERDRCAKIADDWGWSSKPDSAHGIRDAIMSDLNG